MFADQFCINRVLLAAEREMVLAVSVFLEKREKILPKLEIPG